ncbi:spore germination protein GerPE [Cytobacillus suaedae]|nr:spore germination protein GerPE [Cytobacillus suaedae]
MLKRLSKVNSIYVNSVGLGSVVQIGDSTNLRPFSRALAVQREKQIFFGAEGRFEEYPVFTKPLRQPYFYERVNMIQNNVKPTIKVNNIKVTAISASGIVHVGSTENISSESRVKHIRQILSDEEGVIKE